MLAEQQQEVRQQQAGARRQDRLAEERLRRSEDQIASMAQARQELDHKVCITRSCNCVEQCSEVRAHSSLPYQVVLQACPACYTPCCALWCNIMQGRAGQGRVTTVCLIRDPQHLAGTDSHARAGNCSNVLIKPVQWHYSL